MSDDTLLWVVGIAVVVVLGIIGAFSTRADRRSESSYTSPPFARPDPPLSEEAELVAMHKSLAVHEARWRRERIQRSVLVVVAVLGVVFGGVYLFGSDELQEVLGRFVARFGTAGIFLAIGGGAMANAIRISNIYNSWTTSYTLSLWSGVVALLVGVVSLVQAW